MNDTKAAEDIAVDDQTQQIHHMTRTLTALNNLSLGHTYNEQIWDYLPDQLLFETHKKMNYLLLKGKEQNFVKNKKDNTKIQEETIFAESKKIKLQLPECFPHGQKELRRFKIQSAIYFQSITRSENQKVTFTMTLLRRHALE
jgi:hypothetical protein